jgi:hypothetical protein
VSDCNSVKCGECIPLFNYYVNQQEAIFNEDAVITPECPQGYICDNNDPVVIPAGTKKIIPDVPTYDPNLNPDCDYLCEMDLILDTTVPQFGRAEIGNSAITVRCKDIGESEDGTAEYTVPGNLFVVSYNPALKSPQQALAEANQLAWDYGKIKLAEKIASGEMNCNGWDIYHDPGDGPWQPGNVLTTTSTGYEVSLIDPYIEVVTACLGPGGIPPCYNIPIRTAQANIAREYGPYATDKIIRQVGELTLFGQMTDPFLSSWVMRQLVGYFDPATAIEDINARDDQDGLIPGAPYVDANNNSGGGFINTIIPFDISYLLPAGSSVKVVSSQNTYSQNNGYCTCGFVVEVTEEDP